MSGQFGFQTTDPLPPFQGRVTRRVLDLRWAREVLKDPVAASIAASGMSRDFIIKSLPRYWTWL